MRRYFFAAAILGISTQAFAQPAGPVEVMVVGTYHFDNPGLDLNNAKVDDVLKPERQRELERLADALATFRPTKIMIERVTTNAGLVDANYRSFRAVDLAKNRDERVQLGYRLASRLKLPVVHAIDEQPSAGEPAYFPFQPILEWAKANGAGARLDAVMAKGAAATTRLEAAQKTSSIPKMLADRNRAAAIEAEQGMYYELLGFGGIDQQPGADLNAMWYLRNAKIFGKLQLAAQPGDRVLVVYGSGHNYWLRHFITITPGYSLVDAVPYLEKAAAAVGG
jgi:hypothetical protein